MNPEALVVVIATVLIGVCFLVEWAWFEFKFRRCDRRRRARRREQERFAAWRRGRA